MTANRGGRGWHSAHTGIWALLYAEKLNAGRTAHGTVRRRGISHLEAGVHEDAAHRCEHPDGLFNINRVLEHDEAPNDDKAKLQVAYNIVPEGHYAKSRKYAN